MTVYIIEKHLGRWVPLILAGEYNAEYLLENAKRANPGYEYRIAKYTREEEFCGPR